MPFIAVPNALPLLANAASGYGSDLVNFTGKKISNLNQLDFNTGAQIVLKGPMDGNFDWAVRQLNGNLGFGVGDTGQGLESTILKYTCEGDQEPQIHIGADKSSGWNILPNDDGSYKSMVCIALDDNIGYWKNDSTAVTCRIKKYTKYGGQTGPLLLVDDSSTDYFRIDADGTANFDANVLLPLEREIRIGTVDNDLVRIGANSSGGYLNLGSDSSSRQFWLWAKDDKLSLGTSSTGNNILVVDDTSDLVHVKWNLTVDGDLIVNGTTTTVNTTTLEVTDNIILLNNGQTGTPTLNGGIEIERGTEDNRTLRWNETSDTWELETSTGVFEDILTSGDFAGYLPLSGGTMTGAIDMAGNDLQLNGVAERITATGSNILVRAGGSLALTVSSGSLVSTVPFRFGNDGTAGAPALAWNTDTNTGIYRIGADNLGFSANGALVFDYSAAGLKIGSGARVTTILDEDTMSSNSATALATQQSIKAYVDSAIGGGVTFPLLGSNGGQAAPTYSFASDTDCGLYLHSSGDVAISTGSSRRFSVNSLGVEGLVPFKAPNGTAALPGYAFRNDQDSGIYLISSGNYGFSSAGTLRMDLDEDGLNLQNGTRVNEFSTDGTMADDSDTAVPTEKAVREYVSTKVGSRVIFVASSALGDGSGKDASNAMDAGEVYPLVFQPDELSLDGSTRLIGKHYTFVIVSNLNLSSDRAIEFPKYCQECSFHFMSDGGNHLIWMTSKDPTDIEAQFDNCDFSCSTLDATEVVLAFIFSGDQTNLFRWYFNNCRLTSTETGTNAELSFNACDAFFTCTNINWNEIRSYNYGTVGGELNFSASKFCPTWNAPVLEADEVIISGMSYVGSQRATTGVNLSGVATSIDVDKGSVLARSSASTSATINTATGGAVYTV